MDTDKKKDPETYAFIGASMSVPAELGHGFVESVYQDALEGDFKRRDIPFVREEPVPIFYKGEVLGTSYRANFVCSGKIIMELKAIKTRADIESAQVLHYLKATGFHRALLINFGTPRLDYNQFVQSETHLRKSASSAVSSINR